MADSQPRRWTLPFLRELTLTGDARLAAERAGADYAMVCRRRLQEREFAGLWEAALNMRVHWLYLRSGPLHHPGTSPGWSPSPSELGED